MPAFSFSPSIRNHSVVLLLKNGQEITGKVVNVDPTQVTVQPDQNNTRVVVVNRDEVAAYTGDDGRERHPAVPRLVVSRCCNPMMRCNGVKVIAPDKIEPTCCSLRNEHCELYSGDFFSMTPAAQQKLLCGVVIGEYPRRKEDDSESTAKQHSQLSGKIQQAQERTRFTSRGTRPLGGRAAGC